MRLNTAGLIIREQTVGESDRLVTVLTAEYGIIRSFVRNANKIKSRLLSSTQLLSYSRLSIYKGRDSYIIDEAEPMEVFFSLRDSIEKISLAQYFCELCSFLAPEEDNAEEILKLMLNSLYLLSNDKSTQTIIKSVFELRLMSLIGYMPSLVACDTCGEFESDTMFFNIQTGKLYCSTCATNGYETGIGVITAMRHICYAEPKKIFNFSLSEDGEKVLSYITETYLIQLTGRKYKTLDFYRGLI